MTIALKRYKDGSYIPLFNPMSRRLDYGTPQKKKGFIRRVISKGLDNAANGIIRGTGESKNHY